MIELLLKRANIPPLKRWFKFKEVHNMSNEREKWIDNAKGISMLLVIIGHVSDGLSGIWKFDFVYGIH